MRRILAALVLALMLLPALAVLAPSMEAQPADFADVIEESFTASNGIRLHLMTEEDMAEMREAVGTRVDGVTYDVIVDGHHTGLAPPSSESWERLVGSAFIAEVPVSIALNASSAYDMSTNPWFPIVGDQGEQGSCSAWAATYYSYGAVEAKDNGWTLSKSGDSSQLLSPAWTYNRVAYRGPLGGSWMSENFQIIRDWGVPTMATFPYTDSNDVDWGGAAAWRNAPLHRGSQLVFLNINGDATINAIKSLAASDQPVTFAIDSNEFAGHLADYTLSADEYDSPFVMNHALTVVGYDDSKVVAGHPDAGAFRAVNSWGSTWGDGGFCWISYDAFKEIMRVGGNELCYITDIPDYVPSLLAVWHYNDPPDRNVGHNLMIGNPSSYLDTKTPYRYYDSYDTPNALPSFMACDISEFRSYYDNGSFKFSLEVVGGDASAISSFRIESYEGGYSPGSPTQVSAQSSQVPKATPGRLENNFPSYFPISASQALDQHGIEASNPGLTDWVGVGHAYIYGDSALQAGDVGNSYSSVMQINVTGYAGVSFFWKVSSEQSADYLRFYESATKKKEISGDSDWGRVWYNFTEPGTHILKWSYEKSGATSSLQDGAWIDRLQLLPTDDSFEQNDVPGQASLLAASSNFSELMLLDDDWYRVELNKGDNLEVTARFNGSMGNLDMYLYSTDASTLLNSSTRSIGDLESVSVADALNSGNYYLKVTPVDYDITNYSLHLERTQGELDAGASSSLSLTSGTGSFSSITTSYKRVIAFVDQQLNGGLTFDFVNNWSADTTPMIMAYSWGNHSASYQLVYANLSVGSGSGTVTISNLAVPTDPGAYYFILAFRNESEASYVASATSTLRGIPSWGDGNDIAAFDDYQIADAQSVGRSTVNWLMSDSLQTVKVPADAIKVLVIPHESTPPYTQAICDGDASIREWYNSAVNVVLSASDSGSGTDETWYRVDSLTWNLYGGAFSVSGNGQHIVEFYSIDLAGNVESIRSIILSIDDSPPVSSANLVGTMGLDGWYKSTVKVNIASLDGVSGVSTILYRLDGAAEKAYTGEFSVTNDGVHTLYFYAIDVAGNIEDERSIPPFKIDTMKPVVSGTIDGTVGEGHWFVSYVTVTISGSDSSSGIDFIMYQLDSGGWSPYYSSFPLNEEGEHQIEFYAVDEAGNPSETANLAFGIDVTIPSAQSALAGEIGLNGWYVSLVTVNLIGHDDVSGIARLMYRIDGSNWFEYSTGVSIGIDGQHTIDFFAVDRAGNYGTIGTVNLKLDVSGPKISSEPIGTLGLAGWYLSSVSVNAAAHDGNGSGVSDFEFRLDGGQWGDYSGTILVHDDGVHFAEFRAFDIAGNIGPVLHLDIMVDTIAPESSVSITGSLGEKGWYVSAVEVSVEARDDTSGIYHSYMRVNDGNWSIGSVRVFMDGMYQVKYYSMDAAGNSGPIGNVTFKNDLGAPSTTIHLLGTSSENGWFTSNVSLNLTTYDAMSGTNRTAYRIDGRDWLRYSDSIRFDDEGIRLVEYRSFDLAGNVEVLRSYALKIDKTTPSSAAVIQGTEGNGGWYVSALLITVSAADGVSGIDFIEYRIDSGDWHLYSGQIEIDSAGAHVFEHFSKDMAGNVGPLGQHQFRIDNDDPTVMAPMDGHVFTSNRVSLNWTSTDSTSAVSLVELSFDGAPYETFGASSGSIALQNLSDGSHSLLIRVTDVAGNVAVKELRFVVDTNPLSPQGPYGPAPLLAIVFVVALSVGIGVLRLRWHRARS